MSFDQVAAGAHSGGHLSSAIDRALELALQRGGGTRDLDLHDTIRALCAEAKRNGVRAEELIILFKKAWQARPELHRVSREETSRLFDAVVTMCVEQYYDEGR